MDDIRNLIRSLKKITPPKGRAFCYEKHCEWRKDGERTCCLPRCMKSKANEK